MVGLVYRNITLQNQLQGQDGSLIHLGDNQAMWIGNRPTSCILYTYEPALSGLTEVLVPCPDAVSRASASHSAFHAVGGELVSFWAVKRGSQSENRVYILSLDTLEWREGNRERGDGRRAAIYGQENLCCAPISDTRLRVFNPRSGTELSWVYDTETHTLDMERGPRMPVGTRRGQIATSEGEYYLLANHMLFREGWDGGPLTCISALPDCDIRPIASMVIGHNAVCLGHCLGSLHTLCYSLVTRYI
ncbi:hypothetical protein KIPB_003921 [Kipferlia bialata]|uniref:Uncharacterized protein n=1 Tax=Kipferlia bialata TaxID=797122 RepID=A0A9K3CUM8_9EUKA|nr:hypothetical protein KIPB_003921 [Kipferlia bialata]|eukprot:g3921.t1